MASDPNCEAEVILAHPIFMIGMASGETASGKSASAVATVTQDTEAGRKSVLFQPYVKSVSGLNTQRFSVFDAAALDMVNSQERSVRFAATRAFFTIRLKDLIANALNPITSRLSDSFAILLSILTSIFQCASVVLSAVNASKPLMCASVILAVAGILLLYVAHNKSLTRMTLVSLGQDIWRRVQGAKAK